MKKIKTIIAIAFTVGLMSGCSALRFVSMKDIMKIQLGMSRQEVISILGQPSMRFFDDDYEELGFNLGHVESLYHYTITRVRFEDGRVVGMESLPVPVPEVIKEKD